MKAIAMHACVGEKIYLTATPDDEMRKEVSAHHLNMVELFQRPHGYPLIVPEVKRGYSWMQITYLLLFLKSQRKSKDTDFGVCANDSYRPSFNPLSILEICLLCIYI